MIVPRQSGGTGHASLLGVIDGLLILVALAETILLARLALLLGNIGQDSAAAGVLVRVNAALLRPLGLVPAVALPANARQVVAIVGYGAVCFAAVGLVSWFERRRAIY